MQKGKTSVWSGLGWAAFILAVPSTALLLAAIPFKPVPNMFWIMLIVLAVSFSANLMGAVAVVLQRRHYHSAGKSGVFRWVPLTGMLVAGVVAILSFVLLFIVTIELLSADVEERIAWQQSQFGFEPLIAKDNPLGIDPTYSTAVRVGNVDVFQVSYSGSSLDQSITVSQAQELMRVPGSILEQVTIDDIEMVISEEWDVTYLSAKVDELYVRIESWESGRTELIEMVLSLEPWADPNNQKLLGERLIDAVGTAFELPEWIEGAGDAIGFIFFPGVMGPIDYFPPPMQGFEEMDEFAGEPSGNGAPTISRPSYLPEGILWVGDQAPQDMGDPTPAKILEVMPDYAEGAVDSKYGNLCDENAHFVIVRSWLFGRPTDRPKGPVGIRNVKIGENAAFLFQDRGVDRLDVEKFSGPVTLWSDLPEDELVKVAESLESTGPWGPGFESEPLESSSSDCS